MVYLDYAATTPVDPDVISKMTQYLGLDGTFGNAASRSHQFGRDAELAVEKAREQVANLICADPYEIVWTSGATESANLAIKGVAHANADKGKHIVTSTLEHKAVLDTCSHLARHGYEITYLSPDQDGLISPSLVNDSLREDTILVSLMHVNNEVGTITDVHAVGEITRKRRIVFHVDAAQSVSRLSFDVRDFQADLVSISGHKIYGPKGIGALYVRSWPSVELEPQLHGGGHERGIRSGTLATHQAVGMGEAARLMCERRSQDVREIARLDRRLVESLTDIDGASVNGNKAHRVAGIVNVGFDGVSSESLIMSLKDIAISSGSACTSARIEPSYVLRSLGLSPDRAGCSVRFSLGRFNTAEEIEFALARVRESVTGLRELSLGSDLSSNALRPQSEITI